MTSSSTTPAAAAAAAAPPATAPTYSKRAKHLINTGAFTRQSLPDGMPKGSCLEAEVQKLLDSWMAKNNNKHVAISNKSYISLLEESKGPRGLLPSITEHPGAIRTFTFLPSSLGPLEIKDKNGVLLAYRFKIGQGLIDRLRETDPMLPNRGARKQGGGGDPEARGVFDSRHYAAWADYGDIRESQEMEEDQPVAEEWVTANQELFDAMSHELRMQSPEQKTTDNNNDKVTFWS